MQFHNKKHAKVKEYSLACNNLNMQQCYCLFKLGNSLKGATFCHSFSKFIAKYLNK